MIVGLCLQGRKRNSGHVIKTDFYSSDCSQNTGTWSELEVAKSSTWRELEAVRRVLFSSLFQLKGKRIKVYVFSLF